MTEAVYTFIDKSKWGPGVWQDEPDIVVWRDPNTDLPCVIYRHPKMGNFCGYVGVGRDHPNHGDGYDDFGVPVHGGLTYAREGESFLGRGGEREKRLDRGLVEVDVVVADYYWVGFDCNHHMDFAPGMAATMREVMPDYRRHSTDVYRDLDFVKNECRDLAEGLMGLICPLIQLAKCADKEAQTMKPFNWKAMQKSDENLAE
jgi:hypothetical protein